jgi:hypothetical protein
MENLDIADLDEESLRQYRERIVELASDLNGTLASLPEEAQREYREAEQSVIRARDSARAHEGHNWITW